MIKSRKKKCVECGEEKKIFSKGRCQKCASQNKTLKTSPLKKSSTTKKATEGKKELQEKRKEYFEYHINNIKINNISCEECGDSLNGDISEVAHIISKSKNPETEHLKENILYLCGVNSNNQCHAKFDQSSESRKRMKVFLKAVEQVKAFEDKIKNYTSEVRHLIQNK